MNVKFPFEGLPAEQSSIDTSRHSPDELNAANVGAWQYPLIIRLETLADKQPADAAHTLDAREPGSALVAWVQSQTTYVVLGETAPDADDDSKVVRQRIWVQSQFYLLQVRALVWLPCLQRLRFSRPAYAGPAAASWSRLGVRHTGGEMDRRVQCGLKGM